MVDGTAAHERADTARKHALAQAFAQFFDSQFIAVEVFFQQFVIAFSSGFHAHFTDFAGFGHVFRRNLDFRAFAIVPFPGYHLADVDDAAEVLAFADRDLERHDGFAEDGAQFFQAAEEVSMFGIHLVDINHARQFQFDTVVPGPFRIHFNPGFGRNDEQDAVAGTQGGADFAAEFGVPRRIEEIQLIAFPFARRNAELDGDVSLNFFRFIVHNMLVVFTDANGIDSAAGKQ